MALDPNLASRFFESARSAYMDGIAFDFPAEDVLRIASDPLLRFEFQRIWKSEINDADFQRLIRLFLMDLADTLEDEAKGADRKVELIDRGGFTVATGLTVLGIGTTTAAVAKGAAVGSVLGPAGILVGGLVGLAASALGRNTLKKRADSRKSVAGKVRRLTET